MKIFYFTGTGNCLHVANQFEADMYSIPQLIKNNTLEFEDEVIGIIYPCYSMGAPQMVVDFMDKANLKADYFFAIMTHGNHAGAGLEHIERLGKRKGIKFDYTKKVLMIDNFLPEYKIEDQLASESGRKIPEQLSKVVEDIKNKRSYKDCSPLLKDIGSRLLYKSTYTFMMKNNIDRFLKVDDKCNGCGVCSKVCPRGNIRVDDTPSFSHNCDACLSCINNCPKGAMHVIMEKSHMRFRNQHTPLKTIIDANNQLNN